MPDRFSQTIITVLLRHRTKAALAVLKGIETEVLEHIASQGNDRDRFGSLRDVAALHHIKAKDQRRTRTDRRAWTAINDAVPTRSIVGRGHGRTGPDDKLRFGCAAQGAGRHR